MGGSLNQPCRVPEEGPTGCKRLLAGTGERPIFAPASDKDEGCGRGGGSGGSLRQCSEKKEEQKVNRSVAGAKDTTGRRAGAGQQFLQWRV